MNPILAMVEELQRICERRGWTVGLAESCTGGLLSSWIAERPEASHFFQGAVVSYARVVKERVLGVSPEVIDQAGEVSEAVASAMARGARATLAADWAVAITGIAGPAGGTPETPVGTVCFAVAGPGFDQVTTHHFDGQLGRQEIQRRAAVFAMELLLRSVQSL
jgi:PncC family amidohydrolase